MADVFGMIGLGVGGALGLGGLMSFLKGKQLTAEAARAKAQKTPDKASEGKLRELEQQLTIKEASFRQELEQTGQRLKEAEARAESLTQDLAKKLSELGALETAKATAQAEAESLKAQWQEAQQALSTATQAGDSSEELTRLQANLDELRSQLKDAEAKAADAEEQRRKVEEKSEQRLAKLTQMSEMVALDLKQAKDALAVAQTAKPAGPLAGSDIFLNAVVESSHDAVCVINEKSEILSWNRAAEGIFGYASKEATSLNATLLIAHDSRSTFQKALELISAGNERPRTLDVYGIRKDGSAFPIEVVMAGWSDSSTNEKRYVVITHDASERRQAEAMRRDKEAAEEANRAKSQFLANMSHELRTPLNAIIGFSEILHDRTFGELTPKQERYVGNILSSGRHLLQLINDILDLSKIEAGRVQLEYAAFSPLTAVRTVDNLVKALLQKKNITLEVDAGANLPPLIADQSKFKQVLYNLISNAIKFTPEGGKVMVNLGTAAGGSLLQVDVKDTGIGIKPEDQARIFREFEQVDNSYSRQQQGTGLGLALVRKFVEMHGGRIWVESEGEGKGTTFSFTVPFSPNEEPTGGNDKGSKTTRMATAENVATTSAPKAMALVVDDDAAAAELLTHHLQEGGYDVARAANGEDALVLARELKPSIITLDVELPSKSGWEVLQALKADEATRSIPVVVVSVTKERTRALELGAAEFVVKPVERQAFLQTLSDVREIRAVRTASEAEETPARPQRGRSSRAAA